jgi:hypothetical protein
VIVDGVYVEKALARVVEQALAAWVTGPERDSPALQRLLADLSKVAVARPTRGQTADGDARPWLSIPEASKALHRSERSLRRDAKAGRIEARQRRERGPWQVKL